jgi:hypothetical protein
VFWSTRSAGVHERSENGIPSFTFTPKLVVGRLLITIVPWFLQISRKLGCILQAIRVISAFNRIRNVRYNFVQASRNRFHLTMRPSPIVFTSKLPIPRHQLLSTSERHRDATVKSFLSKSLSLYPICRSVSSLPSSFNCGPLF